MTVRWTVRAATGLSRRKANPTVSAKGTRFTAVSRVFVLFFVGFAKNKRCSLGAFPHPAALLSFCDYFPVSSKSSSASFFISALHKSFRIPCTTTQTPNRIMSTANTSCRLSPKESAEEAVIRLTAF